MYVLYSFEESTQSSYADSKWYSCLFAVITDVSMDTESDQRFGYLYSNKHRWNFPKVKLNDFELKIQSVSDINWGKNEI